MENTDEIISKTLRIINFMGKLHIFYGYDYLSAEDVSNEMQKSRSEITLSDIQAVFENFKSCGSVCNRHIYPDGSIKYQLSIVYNE